ncbi:MAG: VWA domain-containing protein [Pyrinomonadaceae bacterium]
MLSVLLRKRLSILVFVFCCLFPLSTTGQSRRTAPTPTPTPDDESVRVITEEIKLNVLAFDEEGRHFSGVTANDLVIAENNILHQPTSVRRVPANVLIVMDTGGELRQVKSLDQTRKTARGVVGALRPEDSVAILQYNDRAEVVSEWTVDKQNAMAAIGRTKFGRRSMFVDALRLSREFLMKSGLDNKHLVLITDGTDSSAPAATKHEALRDLLATDISVHVLSYTGLEITDITPRTKAITNSPPPKAMPDEIAATLPPGARDVATTPKMKAIFLDRKHLKTLRNRKADLEISQQQLSTLAENTNGEFILPESTDEMVEKTALIAKLIDSSYVVTYTPKIPVSENRDTGMRERNIIVTSKRPGLIVEARRKLVIEKPRG